MNISLTCRTSFGCCFWTVCLTTTGTPTGACILGSSLSHFCLHLFSLCLFSTLQIERFLFYITLVFKFSHLINTLPFGVNEPSLAFPWGSEDLQVVQQRAYVDQDDELLMSWVGAYQLESKRDLIN